VAPIRDGLLGPGQWALWWGWMIVQLYSEGYRGFQRAFSPRVVARAFHLAAHPRWHLVLLAPLYCMGFVHATRRRLVTSYVFVAALVGVIVVVQKLPQPWRGIVDAGVVAGLVWGVIALAVFFARALAGHAMPVPADVPMPAPPPICADRPA
jgi:hypothetical protein